MPYPYSFIQRWWGEPLSPELQKRIEEAPARHLDSFIHDWDAISDSLLDIPPKPEGILRPLLRRFDDNIDEPQYAWELSIALNVLLYAHQIVMDPPARPEFAQDVSQVTAHLLDIKPLVDAGVMHLAWVGSRVRHPSARFDIDSALPIARQACPELYGSLGKDAFEGMVDDVVALIKFSHSHPNLGNPFARFEEEYAILAALLRETWIDRAHFDMTSLARMSVPNLNGNLRDLIAVRQSEESFALWREALSRAIMRLSIIPDDDANWQRDAREIMTAELEPLREKVIRDNAQSRALATLNRGASAMLIAGTGVTAGWATGGSITSGLAASGVTTGVTYATAYLKSLKERRRNKAILDLALAFGNDA